MSEEYMKEKFGRKRKKSLKYFTPSFEVENYLHYNGEKFTSRFDANSFLYLTKAMDFFDVRDEIKKIKTKNASLIAYKGKLQTIEEELKEINDIHKYDVNIVKLDSKEKERHLVIIRDK